MANDRIILRTGEALVEAEPAWSAAEPEVVIGELDGPVGIAMAHLIGEQAKGHSKVFAILNSDVQVKPATIMVSKVRLPNSLNAAARSTASPRSTTLPVMVSSSGFSRAFKAVGPETSIRPVPAWQLDGAMNTGACRHRLPRAVQRSARALVGVGAVVV